MKKSSKPSLRGPVPLHAAVELSGANDNEFARDEQSVTRES